MKNFGTAPFFGPRIFKQGAILTFLCSQSETETLRLVKARRSLRHKGANWIVIPVVVGSSPISRPRTNNPKPLQHKAFGFFTSTRSVRDKLLKMHSDVVREQKSRI